MTINEVLRGKEANELAVKLSDLFLCLNKYANMEDDEITTYDMSFTVADKLKVNTHIEFEVEYLDEESEG